jgi:leader peptidase (prepilin peptidase)/N-methyltransferase
LSIHHPLLARLRGPRYLGSTDPSPIVALALSPEAYVFAGVLGALLGSFGNVCILRIPAGMSIARPPSHCFVCKTPVRWFDNLPLVSWLLLRGKCRKCGATFSPRYLLVEGAMLGLALATYHFCLTTADDPLKGLARFGVYLLFELALVVITFIDLDHKKIPDKITYPGIPLFLGFGLLLGDLAWHHLVIGVVGGYGVVRALSDGYYWATGREGLGYGDGKLLALIGGLFGWQAVLFSLFGGSVLGTAIMLPALLLKKREEGENVRHLEIPFGPFLAAAALVYLFLGNSLSLGSGILWPW